MTGLSGRARRAFAASVGVSASAAMPLFLTGALAAQIKEEFVLGDAMFGAALSGLFVVAGLGAISGGAFADRMGWPTAIRTAGLAAAVSLLTIAALARSTPVFVAALLLGGGSMAIGGPSGALVIANELPARVQGLAFGLKNAAAPLISVLAGLSVPFLALTVGWRWAFLCGAAVPAATVLVVPRSPSDRSVLRARPPRLRGTDGMGSLLSFTLASGCAMAAVGALTGFIVVSAIAGGMALSSAGFLVAAAGGFGLVVRVGVGWAADRLGVGGFRPTLWLLLGGAVGYSLLISTRPWLVVVGALLAYGGGWGWTGLMQYGVVRAYPQAPARAAGFVQVGMACGAAIGPLGFGVAAQRFGYGAAWMGASLAGWGAVLLVLDGLRRLDVAASAVATSQRLEAT